MVTDPHADLVVKMLRAWEFAAERLPETPDERTADIFALFGAERYFIEVKRRADRDDRARQLRAAFTRGALFEEHETMGVRNRAAEIAKDAIDQIEAHLPRPTDFRILWFLAFGRKADVFLSQMRNTLLGATMLIDIRDSWQRECYFFHNSVFFRWRTALDGAVLSSEEEGQLLVNPYSPRIDALRQSRLVDRFGRGVLDPTALANAGEACLVSSDIDRKDSQAVLRWLQTQTGRPTLMTMNLGYMAVWAGFDANPEGG